MISRKALIILSAICEIVNSANILALMGVASPSHHIWNSAILHELGERGHNVTILSIDISKKSTYIPKNVHYIYLDDVYSYLYEDSTEPLNLADFMETGAIEGILLFYKFSNLNAQAVLQSKGHNKLLNYPKDFKFDLIIYDFTCGSFLLGYFHRFNYPPLIGISAFLNPPNSIDLVGGHKYPGYVPFYILLYDIKMTSIALVNSHPAVNYPEPFPPNLIEIGGVQIKDPKPLPKDLENFINKSKKGTIFFSLGTNIKSTDLGPDICKIFLDAMTELSDYNFLWKTDLDVKNYVIPKNILIQSFFPQTDILAHSNIKLFITHSGALSTQESTWRGVPMLGIPFFADQYRNLENSIHLGIAEKITLPQLSIDLFKEKIRKIVENSTYTKNIKKHSARYRDRPMKAIDTAIWWIEYVLRDPQPNHLRSPETDIGFIPANSIDFYFILFFGTQIFLFLLYKLFKVCFSFRTEKYNKIESKRSSKKSKQL